MVPITSSRVTATAGKNTGARMVVRTALSATFMGYVLLTYCMRGAGAPFAPSCQPKPEPPLVFRLHRLDAQHLAIVVIGQHIDRAIRRLLHIADAGFQWNPLLLGGLLAVDPHPHDALCQQTTNQHAALPGRKQVAGVKPHARGRDAR